MLVFSIENNQFINAVTGNPEKAKAALLQSATQNVTPYTISHHGLRVVLVDTPGFDDTLRPDMDILRRIADWLTKKYLHPDQSLTLLMLMVYKGIQTVIPSDSLESSISTESPTIVCLVLSTGISKCLVGFVEICLYVGHAL